MKLRKWNPTKREYEPYEVPDDWHVSTYSENMDEVVNCAQCGREMTFGIGYTSRRVHTTGGFGYMVCEGCYGREREEERV
jgi:hypothetical protein